MEQRIAWNDLPATLRKAIEARTGPITAARTATAGENSPLAAIVETANGTTFVKGSALQSSPRDHSTARGGRGTALGARDLPRAALVLRRGRVERARLRVRRRPSRGLQSGGPTTLELLVPLMRVLGEITIEVPNTGVFKLAEDRWKTYVEDPASSQSIQRHHLDAHGLGTAQRTRGSRPGVADRLGVADPRRGLDRPSALDHQASWRRATPRSRRRHRRCDCRRSSPQRNLAHVDLFAAVNVRLWNEIEQADAGARSWTITMAEAARDWSAYRHAEP